MDDSVVERLVDPLGVVLKAGVWYLVARSGTEMRTYRISRILHLTIQQTHFERPEEFELASYWERSVAAYAESLPSLEVTVRMPEESLDRAFELLSRSQARAAIEASGGPDGTGWRTLEVTLEDGPEAARSLLALGPDVEVVAPPELRAAVAAAALKTADLYR
jgi:predicted DNA-binding transcriptional regulator YafY